MNGDAVRIGDIVRSDHAGTRTLIKAITEYESNDLDMPEVRPR
jgi:hypothetical protein